MRLSCSKCVTKVRLRPGLCSEPHWGSLQHSPNSLALLMQRWSQPPPSLGKSGYEPVFIIIIIIINIISIIISEIFFTSSSRIINTVYKKETNLTFLLVRCDGRLKLCVRRMSVARRRVSFVDTTDWADKVDVRPRQQLTKVCRSEDDTQTSWTHQVAVLQDLTARESVCFSAEDATRSQQFDRRCRLNRSLTLCHERWQLVYLLLQSVSRPIVKLTI